MKKTNENGWVRAFNAQRRQWKPGMGVTKVIPDKRRDPPKYEADWNLEDDDFDYDLFDANIKGSFDSDGEDWDIDPDDIPFIDWE